MKEETPTTREPSAQPLVEQARSDLARRLSVPAERIEVVEVRSVVWPDGSLGCPQPGMRYIQVLTDGALILLRYEGRTYEYHSGGSRPPFLCEQASPGAKPIVPKLDPFATPPRSGNQ